MWLQCFSTKLMYQKFCLSVFRNRNEWMTLKLKNNHLFKPHWAGITCVVIFYPANKPNIAHLSYDLLFPHLKWRKSSEVSVLYGRSRDVTRGLFWATALEMFTILTFYFCCCRGENINLCFCTVWSDIWHGNKIRQSVYKFTEVQHLGFSQCINCWWDSAKHQKSILFSFLELHSRKSLNILFLKDKPGFFHSSSHFLSGDGQHDCRHSKGPTLVQSCLWLLLAQPGQWGLYLIKDFCKPAFFPYNN